MFQKTMIAVSLVILLLLSLASTTLPFSTTPSPSPPTTTTSSHVTENNSNKLFPFQEDGVSRLVADVRLLLADDMGLGKTVQSIVALNRLFKSGKISPTDCRVLIICPKSVVSVWMDELERWIDERYFSIRGGNGDGGLHVVSAGKTQTEPLDAESSLGTIQIINYDICHKYEDILQETPFDVLICDEAHYLKSAQSRRTGVILGTYESNGIQSTYLWFLTGTPILNRPNEIYPLLWALNKQRWESFDAFKKKWGQSFDEVSNLGELKKLMKPLILRRKKVDVLQDLPPKLYSMVTLDGSEEAAIKEEKFALKNFEDDISAARIKNGSSSDSEEALGTFGEGATLEKYGVGEDIMTYLDLGKLAKIRSFTASLKVEPAIQLLKQYIMCEKVVVFAHHREVILRLKEEFGNSCVHIIGGMDGESRADAVNRFQHDESCRLFIGSIRAAGVGLTLTASSHVVFLELDWSPGIMTQAEDRCHRVGQCDSVLIEYFVFKGTIDGWMARQLARKSQGIRSTLTQRSRRSRPKHSNYKLDFGKYKGCSLDDIPFNYLSNYLMKEDVYKKKLALWNALYLSDVIDEAPLNLMLEHIEDEEGADGVAYTFDFGQYYGMEWCQVPQSYRDWVVITKSLWQKHKGLWIALHEGGLVAEEPELSENESDEPGKQIVPEIDKRKVADEDGEKTGDVAYTFDFGQYFGVRWSQVPQSYRNWVVETKGVWQKHEGLWIALHEGGLVAEDPELFDNKSKKLPKQNIPEIDRSKVADVDYTFDFGRFNGLHWRDVNKDYQDWIIKTKDVWQKRQDLWNALYNVGIIEEEPQ